MSNNLRPEGLTTHFSCVSVQLYEYWLEDMYLNNRLALPVNSSPAMVFPKQTFKDQRDALRYVPPLFNGCVSFTLFDSPSGQNKRGSV